MVRNTVAFSIRSNKCHKYILRATLNMAQIIIIVLENGKNIAVNCNACLQIC
jgi:hypothetical protein